MLKTFDEMYKIDVMPYTEKRDNIPYLPWPKVYQLLHDNGATTVWHEPIVNERTGSTLFMTDQVFGTQDKTHRCYEVRVRIVIDDLDFIMNYPLINGTNPVKDNSISQLRICTAQQRAFVKGVAMRTGLGFKLWEKDPDDATDDLSRHSIIAIKKRVEQMLTIKLQNGLTMREIADALGMNEKGLNQYIATYDSLQKFEAAVSNL